MKKQLAAGLVIVMVLTLLFPLQALAQYDKELEQAISTAKSLLNISKDYDTFNYSIHKQNDRTLYNLRWTDTKNKLGEISVAIDSKGKIQNYYLFKPYTGRDRQKLPKVSKEDALKIANAFIRKVNPDAISKVRFVENNAPVNINDGGYRFLYNRVENGVEYPNNNISITVDGATGEVQNYYYTWSEDLNFPDTAGAMDLATAEGEYKNKLGLTLAYKMNYNDREKKPYLVYTNVYNNYFLDAKTGEVVIGDSYFGFYGGEKDGGMGPGLHSYAADNKQVSLTPQEQAAVKSASDIMDEIKAESLARAALQIDSSFKLNNISLYSDWFTKEDYTWSMDFSTDKKESSGYTGTSVSLDAKTGEVLNFYRYTPYEEKANPIYSQEQAQNIAEDFIKSMQPERYKEVVKNNWRQPYVEPVTETKPRQYSFNYTRLVNGALFLDNGFNITVDTISGKVQSYNFSWYKKELPAPEKMLTADQAHQKFFKEVGIQLQYIPQYSVNGDVKILPEPNREAKADIKLVYAMKQGKPANIDAVTGELLGYDGKPYLGGKVVEYTDIRGNFAENQIKVLAEYGIALPGSQLNPNQHITQREFLYLLLRATNPWVSVDPKDDKDIDNLYNSLISAGIVKDGEKAPNAVITRQEAVKFIVRALNYDKVAEIKKDIFKLPFKDVQSIKPGYKGYMAVAYGLNIVHGNNGKCNPQGSLTRAQAFVLIYNLLNVS